VIVKILLLLFFSSFPVCAGVNVADSPKRIPGRYFVSDFSDTKINRDLIYKNKLDEARYMFRIYSEADRSVQVSNEAYLARIVRMRSELLRECVDRFNFKIVDYYYGKYSGSKLKRILRMARKAHKKWMLSLLSSELIPPPEDEIIQCELMVDNYISFYEESSPPYYLEEDVF
jgi:hypothetical protein